MTAVMPALNDRRQSADAPRRGPLGRLAGLAYRRRGSVLIAWALALAIAFGLSAALGGETTNGASAPGSDSEQAQRLLGERFPTQSGDTVRVVVRADDVTGTEVRGDVNALLAELGHMPHVASVEDPYATTGSITLDGRTLVARIYLDVTNANDMPVEATNRMLAAAVAAERDGPIALGGRRATRRGEPGPDPNGSAARGRGDPPARVRFGGGGRAAVAMAIGGWQ
jgi:RND superfamily putative drug exporter